MGDGNTAGLLGVILEVSLSLHVSMVTDDLDGVLVSTDSTVSTKSPELASLGSLRSNVRIAGSLDGKVGNVIKDGKSEFLLGFITPEVFEYCQYVAGLYVLGTESVTSACDEAPIEFCAAESSYDIEEKRFAESAGFLGSVKNSDLLHCLRKNVKEILGGPRSVKVNFHDTYLLALGCEPVNDFLCAFADGSHGYHYFSCIFCTVVIERLVVGSDLGIYFLHVLVYEVRSFSVYLVAGFSVLEECFRLLCRTHGMRMIRMKGIVLECL